MKMQTPAEFRLHIWRSGDTLPPLTKLVAYTISYFANSETGACYPSIRKISQFSGLSTGTVQKAVEQLRLHRMIEIKLGRVPGQKTPGNHYIFSPSVSPGNTSRGNTSRRNTLKSKPVDELGEISESVSPGETSPQSVSPGNTSPDDTELDKDISLEKEKEKINKKEKAKARSSKTDDDLLGENKNLANEKRDGVKITLAAWEKIHGELTAFHPKVRKWADENDLDPSKIQWFIETKFRPDVEANGRKYVNHDAALKKWICIEDWRNPVGIIAFKRQNHGSRGGV